MSKRLNICVLTSGTLSAGGSRTREVVGTGLRAIGAQVHFIDRRASDKLIAGACGGYPDAVVAWGWRKGKMLAQTYQNVIVLERGYIGDRFAWTSVALNGLNGKATWPEVDCDGSRFERHHSHLYKEWSATGEYALMLGQVPGDASLGGRHLYKEWYPALAARMAAAYGLPVRWRAHPLAESRGAPVTIPGTENISCTLLEALHGASISSTFNSNSAVDAMLAGKPVVAFDDGSMAWDVALHDLPLDIPVSEPKRRRQWAENLAWRQWLPDEIASGAAFAPLVKIMSGV